MGLITFFAASLIISAPLLYRQSLVSKDLLPPKSAMSVDQTVSAVSS
jgi:hypothetical protein